MKFTLGQVGAWAWPAARCLLSPALRMPCIAWGCCMDRCHGCCLWPDSLPWHGWNPAAPPPLGLQLKHRDLAGRELASQYYADSDGEEEEGEEEEEGGEEEEEYEEQGDESQPNEDY